MADFRNYRAKQEAARLTDDAIAKASGEKNSKLVERSVCLVTSFAERSDLPPGTLLNRMSPAVVQTLASMGLHEPISLRNLPNKWWVANVDIASVNSSLESGGGTVMVKASTADLIHRYSDYYCEVIGGPFNHPDEINGFPEEDDVKVVEKNVDDELTKTEGKLSTSQISEDCHMPNEQVLSLDISAEIDHYFDDSSVPRDGEPRIAILMGGPAVGKTTIRKQCFATGYVLVDAAEIFLSLSHGKFFPFPDAFEQPMDIIGGLIARRAISERRHIVTELIGSDYEPTKNLIEAMRAVGYMVDVQGITCGIEEAQHRNISRSDDNISCYYAEPYQRRWLLEAAYATKS